MEPLKHVPDNESRRMELRGVVRLAGEEHLGRASPVTDPEERHRCGDLMGAKYVWEGDPGIGLTYEAWCYDVPAVAIEF